MEQKIVVRSGGDRLRFTVLFELVLIAILAPAGAVIFDRQVLDIGFLSIILSGKAMLINLAYNWLFDRIDVRAGRVPSERTFAGRIVHAAGFELSLVLTSLPLVIWWLGLTVMQALVMDVAITSVVLVYTVVFGWCYDRWFPVPQRSGAIGCAGQGA